MIALTVGHSNRTLEEFLRILQLHGVTRIADVRTVPRSRRNPHFSREELPAALAAHGIGYSYLGELGGLRRPRPDSQNAGWQNESFRGYADYMQTPEFAAGIERLLALLAADPAQRVALMCAEAVPWRCHRSLLGDALLVRRVEVEDILGPGPRRPHKLTPWARVEGTGVTYPLPLLP